MLNFATNRDCYKPYCIATVCTMDWRKRMEQRRKELKLTQEQMAERMGMTLASWGHWAHGRREPDLRTFERIAAALECNGAWLVFGVQEPSDQRTAHVLEVMERLPDYKREVLAQVADSLLEKKASSGN